MQNELNRSLRNPLRPGRMALTLLEVVGMLSVTAAVMSLSAVVMHRAFAAHRDAMQHLQQTEHLQQMVHRWRQDVRSAQRVSLLELDGEPRPLLIDMAGDSAQQITYRWNQELLSREVHRQGELLGSEQWSLPQAARVNFSIARTGRHPLVTSRLDFSEQKSASSLEWYACAMAVQAGEGIDD